VVKGRISPAIQRGRRPSHISSLSRTGSSIGQANLDGL
jgi:hypothetical protein